MEIGIIGGGAAGLTAAWLLQENHKVTLLERQDRLGGHAQTIDVRIGGETISIDAGVDFFTQRLWPTFYRLLHILEVPLYRYPGTMTLYTKDHRQIYPMPLMRDGRISWDLLKPAALSRMLQFQHALQCARPLVEAMDTSVTTEQFTEGLRLDRSFKDDFCYPLLLAIWCTEMEDFKRFAAYNALKYYVMCEGGRFSQFHFTEVVGGMRIYIETLAKSLTRTRVKTSIDIKQVMHRNRRFAVEDIFGNLQEFDHLIVATNAIAALELISGITGSEPLQRQLRNFEYFKGTTAVHGDRRYMPINKKHWSVFNIRHDDAHSALTVWKRWKSTKPVFKSWITHEPHPPEPLYFAATYEHPKVTPSYFAAQRALAPFQGQNNLWLAGLYTHDIDSHESAIVSAVKIVQVPGPRVFKPETVAEPLGDFGFLGPVLPTK